MNAATVSTSLIPSDVIRETFRCDQGKIRIKVITVSNSIKPSDVSGKSSDEPIRVGNVSSLFLKIKATTVLTSVIPSDVIREKIKKLHLEYTPSSAQNPGGPIRVGNVSSLFFKDQSYNSFRL